MKARAFPENIKELNRVATGRTMIPATRVGNVWYIYGSQGDIYEVSKLVREDGTERWICSCDDFAFRRSVTGEDCKHGKVAQKSEAENV